jgi:hypothetical protein
VVIRLLGAYIAQSAVGCPWRTVSGSRGWNVSLG